MHQTFYIDIDEEITSIVEKLKNARVSEIIMVVPRHALLIQSIVNLRILKKEADDAGLQLMIVTQDKLGKILIEKAGIFVQQKMDNISDEEITTKEYDDKNINDQAQELNSIKTESISRKNRLNEIGSSEYFDEGEEAEKKRESLEEMKKKLGLEKTKQEENEKLVNKELISGTAETSKKQSIDIAMKKNVIPKEQKINKEEEFSEKQNIPTNINLRRQLPKDELNAIDFSEAPEEEKQDRKIESFFHQQENFERKPEKKVEENLKEYSLAGGSHKFFWFFGLATVLIIFGVGAYLFLPKADLKIITKMENKSVDSEIVGSVSATSSDYDKKIIPAKKISLDEELTKTFDSTGDKAVSNQKAKGKITIYNEYSTSPQPLVATTRFLSEDGKLFRLVKGVTIPGMTKEGTEMKPGTIEAEVVADQAGKEFNIEPSKFTIPGFESSGGEKYTKFYGKTEWAMTGGGDSGEKINSVTEEDIAAAKKSIMDSLDDFTRQKIQEKAGDGMIILDDGVKKEDVIFSVSNYAGDITDSFSVSAIVKAETIVVADKDFKEMIGKMIAGSGKNQSSFDYDTMSLDFGKTNIDFEAETISIKFHASGKMNPNVDLDEIKKGILGKKEDSLKAYLSDFDDIKQIEIIYWPVFINSKIPSFESRVNVTLDKQ